eukprot:CAMPEP_0172914626 /NCGR_PEP_ID=MMETSP1075-20121228/192755_1 /TAXON_ID=2916 /ORGANISM="Ceratium fusus, Strain PA161109" /LENGTH=142 /DNA_ID=CAMNT_0013773571 /DNA_START=76 /DNA_END=505 /DNA_ORIENTATION=-
MSVKPGRLPGNPLTVPWFAIPCVPHAPKMWQLCPELLATARKLHAIRGTTSLQQNRVAPGLHYPEQVPGKGEAFSAEVSGCPKLVYLQAPSELLGGGKWLNADLARNVPSSFIQQILITHAPDTSKQEVQRFTSRCGPNDAH